MRDINSDITLPKEILLSDYKKHDFTIDKIDLTFDLAPKNTVVTAISAVKRNGNHHNDLVLNGEKMTLQSVTINNTQLTEQDYTRTDTSLTIHNKILPEDDFTLQIQTIISPADNTELEGLYQSNGMYCTQCEAEGFRRITYYIDRPDNMAEFFVTIIGVADGTTPVLLSNGNLLKTETTPEGRMVARWHDPFKKPCYLFALVAGDLACLADSFTTQSGRTVDLKIYVNHGNEHACDYAMDSLKRSMKWDEEVYNLEYDLDLFMIVAVDDFNFGAMENKGLNIFNSKYILAEPDTATDTDYENIEGIVAHEYFHNWTGNRVTCRDWFQLCLKEGLTVYRDQSFSGDMRSNATKRIDDVINLRLGQFSEDAGALSHPVRPESYIEINNFYTSTVYEKGAELCRMLHMIIGKENFFKGIALYFKRFDGMAVTVEDFIQAMADASHTDLSQFLLWYKQPGTPHIDVKTDYDPQGKTFTITLKQSIQSGNKNANTKPYLLEIPIVTALIGQDGTPLDVTFKGETKHVHLLILQQETTSFTFENVTQHPVPSLLRQFSAPVTLSQDYLSHLDKLHLMRYDTDSFNRYEAGQIIAENIIQHIYKSEDYDHLLPDYLAALQDIVTSESLDNAFKAYALSVPSLTLLLQKTSQSHPKKMLEARKKLIEIISETLAPVFKTVYNSLNITEAFAPTAEQAARRQLKNSIMGYLIKANQLSDDVMTDLYNNADNMTDRIAILNHLSVRGCELYEILMNGFYYHFEKNPLVIDKWFAIQARSTADNVCDKVTALLNHPAFTYQNPNRARSLIGVFLHGNPAYFHSVQGYDFAKTEILKLDKLNPKTAARMATAFENVALLETELLTHAKQSLEKILEKKENISNDLYEITSKIAGSL